MDLDLLHARSFAEEAARGLGPFLREGFGSADVTRRKSTVAADVVTKYDEEADQRLRDVLTSFDASLGFEGEEVGASGSRSTYWLTDPIDGTAHFVRGNALCTTMIALVHDNQPVVSVIYDFVTDRMYSAALGMGATCDEHPIRVADRSLRESYVCVEMHMNVNDNASLYARLQESCVTMKSINTGWEFSGIAAGRLDGRIQKDPWGYPWDFAPGALLVKEAGGLVANLGTTSYDVRNLNFIAAPPTVFRELTEGSAAFFPID